ncbi:hypothetical protein ACE6H2_008968 [Prunus campanulata]
MCNYKCCRENNVEVSPFGLCCVLCLFFLPRMCALIRNEAMLWGSERKVDVIE